MKSKFVLLLSILVYSTKLFSQAAPLVQVTIPNPNPVCNPGDCTQLQANYNTIKQTNDYAVSSIIYNPNFPFVGGTVIENSSDDSWTQIVNLPFTFCFYGQAYNQLLVGTNGVITFNTSGPNYTPGGACRWSYNATIPNADANFIRNAIFGVYQDTNILPGALDADTTPNNIQNVNYYVLDTGPNAAPNRVFVANFNELPQFSCNATAGLQTSQIIIYETTNIIDVLISKRTPCLNWNSGSGLVGIQNATGTLTRVPPNRNTGTWSATNEAWRFTPNGAVTVPSSVQWFQADGVTPAAAANVNPITVCPTGPETYIAKVTYTICNGQPTVVQKAVNIDVTQLPVNNPVDLVVCSSTPLPCVDLDQTLFMQTGLANPAWYDITFYDDLTAAQNAAGPPNLLLGTNLTNYCLTSNPQTFYARIEDLAVTGCVQIRPFTVSVSSSPSGTFTYDNSPYCSSITLAQANNPVGLSPGGTFSAVPNGTTPATNVLSIDPTTGAITPSLSNVGTYTVNYNLAASTSCPAYATSTTVEIIACSCTVTANSTSETACLGFAITPMNFTVSGGGDSGAITAGTLPVGITANFAGGVLTISGSSTAQGTYQFTVSITSGTDVCTINAQIVINGNPTQVLSSALGTDNQSVCPSAAITPISYTISGGGTGAFSANLPTGISGTYNAGVYTITGSGATPGTYNYTVTTTGGCAPITNNGTIVILNNHSIALNSVASTESQTVCVNTAITPITYTLSGGATGATVTGLPSGVTFSVTGTTLTISGTPNTTVGSPFTYSISTTGNTCAVATDGGTITVNQAHAIGLSSVAATENQSVCVNNAITPITYTLSGGATGATVTGLPTGVGATIVGTTLTISGTPSITTGSPFGYSIITTGNTCATATDSGSITVTTDHTITLSSAVSTETQSVCINTAITAITYTLASGATGANVTGLPTGVNASVSGTTLTISGSPSVTGTFTYAVTTTGNACAVATEGGSITISNGHTLTPSSAPNTFGQAVCINTAIANVTYALGGGATGANVTGLPAGVSASVSGSTLTISGSPTTITGSPFTYSITTTGNSCAVALGGDSIIVNPLHSMVLSSASPTETQILCVNTAIAPITYTLGGGATGANVTGLPAGVSAVVAGTTLTISGTPSTTTGSPFAYAITTTGNTCAVATDSGSITVEPIHTLTLTTAPASAFQTICLTDAISPITYTIGGGATAATVTGLPTGVTASLVGSTITISGTPASTSGSPFNFTLVTTGNSCLTATLNGSITVNPPATIVITSALPTASQELCINTPIVPITYLVGNGATNAALVTSFGNFPAGVTGVYDAVTGIYTISGTPTVSGIFPFQINTSGGCPSIPVQGRIKVNPNATIALTSAAATANQSICNGAAMTPIFYTVGNGAVGATLSGMPAGITSSFAAGVLTISGSSLIVGTYNYSVTTFGGCSSATLTGVLEIKPNVTLALTSAPSTAIQTLCVNEPIIPIQYTVGNGATSAAILSGSVPYGIVAQFNAGVLTISGTPTEYSTFHFTTTTIGGCSTASLTATLYIRSLPEFRLQQDGTICVDAFGVPNPGATFTLDTQLDPLQYTFEWSDINGVILGQNSSSYVATIPSTYSVKATSIATGCSAIVSAVVSPALPPLSAIANVSTEFTDQQLVQVFVEPQGFYEYQLDGGPFQTQNYFTNLTSGFHQIIVRNACGELAPIEVRIIDYPTFFTPNNDTYNDYWNISDLADQPDAQIYIYDRFGKLIKQIQPSGLGWDGTYNGQPLPSTDYWFNIDYLNQEGDPRTFKSHFSLKR